MKRRLTGWQAWGLLLIVFVVAISGYIVIGSFTRTEAQVPAGDIIVEGKIELAPGGDQNKNGEVDAGDTVALAFRLTNRSDTAYPFATLATGLNADLVYDFWNLNGAASLSNDNGTVTFPNLIVPARSQLTISVEATVKYFTEAGERLAVLPELLDQAGHPIGQTIPHVRAERLVSPWIGELPPWVVMPPISDDPLAWPYPTPTSTTEPSPSVSPTVEPTQPSPQASAGTVPTTEPSPTTSLEPTPTATLEPTPPITATLEPSPSSSPSPL